MTGRGFQIPERPSYGGCGHAVIEERFDPALTARGNAVFALGNGFIGLCGVFEEEAAAGAAAVYLNGVYETVPIRYHEKAAGFAEEGDVRPAAPNALPLGFEVDGTPFDLRTGKLLDYRRSLDFRTGILERAMRWQAPSGAVLDIRFERIVCFERRELAAVRLTITPEGTDVDIALTSFIEARGGASVPRVRDVHDPRLGPEQLESPWRVEDIYADASIIGLVARTKQSGTGLAAAALHDLGEDAQTGREDIREADQVSLRWRTRVGPGSRLQLTKYIAYASDFGTRESDLRGRARAVLEDARAAGFDALAETQRAYLAGYWHGAALEIEGDGRSAQAVRFAMFQVLQAAGRGGCLSVAAKGQTGEGYEGHYFWDAEIFTLPMLVFTAPDIARDLLRFRHATLEAARANARRLGHARGAAFPWRTISGRECSAYFPAGAAQYHINAGIAYALRQYVEATGDTDFLFEYGAELLFETARLWLELGSYSAGKGGAFTINTVTGPDEYTALVDNNLYTNAMARAHLRFAVRVAQDFERLDADGFGNLRRGLALDDAEIESWSCAADAMYLPCDEARQLYAQDDSFLDKPLWDFAATPESDYPLLLHHHPMTLYRHQLSKQADIVLAMFLLSNEFEAEARRRVFDHYEKVTVHDSTLSPCIHSIVASDVGRNEAARTYFDETALIDLEDLHGNTSHGLHIAAMGGTWMSLTFGFAGMRLGEDGLSFSPGLPRGWAGYSFTIRYRGRRIAVEVGEGTTRYRLLEGDDLTVRHHAEELCLAMDAPRSCGATAAAG